MCFLGVRQLSPGMVAGTYFCREKYSLSRTFCTFLIIKFTAPEVPGALEGHCSPEGADQSAVSAGTPLWGGLSECEISLAIVYLRKHSKLLWEQTCPSAPYALNTLSPRERGSRIFYHVATVSAKIASARLVLNPCTHVPYAGQSVPVTSRSRGKIFLL